MSRSSRKHTAKAQRRLKAKRGGLRPIVRDDDGRRAPNTPAALFPRVSHHDERPGAWMPQCVVLGGHKRRHMTLSELDGDYAG